MSSGIGATTRDWTASAECCALPRLHVHDRKGEQFEERYFTMVGRGMVTPERRSLLSRLRCRWHRRALARLVAEATAVPGWRRHEEALELAEVSYLLPAGAVIVEVGALLGSGTVLLAGARKLRGSGRVHSIDPFDASGDPYSAPFYRAIADAERRSLRQRFEENISRLGLSAWVAVHEGTAESVGAVWRTPIDLLLLDGDHSPEGARAAFERWTPFLKSGGLVVLPNSSDRVYEQGHDGHRRLVLESLVAPRYTGIYLVGTTTFGCRQAVPARPPRRRGHA